jgi:hypothetical protein
VRLTDRWGTRWEHRLGEVRQVRDGEEWAPAAARPLTPGAGLGKHSGVADRKAADEHSPDRDTELLIAALNHAWAWYDARINRGLQVVNFFLLALAVLIAAYVSAINAKHYALAAVIGISGTALTGATFAIGSHQRRRAGDGTRALDELQDLVANRLKLDSFRMVRGRAPARYIVRGSFVFAIATLLGIASVLYALIH